MSIAVIHSEKPSHWLSCQFITSELRKLYRLAFGEKVQEFSFHDDLLNYEIYFLARSIYKMKPKKIVFVDHFPHPRRLLEVLSHFYGSKMPVIDFHVYGDFTMYPMSWAISEPLIENSRFVCASPRQAEMVGQFVKNPGSIQVIPFSLDQKDFRYEEERRRRWRRKQKIGPDEKVLLYAGRISPEKNVERMARLLCPLVESDPELTVIIAGGFDDLGAEKFGISLPNKSTETHWYQWHDSLPEDTKARIRFVGSYRREELHSVYCAADLFVSMSTYHDEDFGMSPLEGLFTGLPCVLTNWAGYAGFFFDESSAVSLVDVTINDRGIFAGDFVAEVQRKLEKRSDRKKTAEQYRKWFSTQSLVKRLRHIQKSNDQYFGGFTSKFFEYRDRYDKFTRTGFKRPLFPEGPVRNGYYFEIYEPYYAGEDI